MHSQAPLVVDAHDDFPPEHWYLSDGFNMPITRQTQRREDALRQTFEAHVAREKRDASILANVALRWDPVRPGVGVDPDIQWVEPRLPDALRSVLTWVEGVAAPRLAVEIVSRDTADKDYRLNPAKYAASGTRELWVFDPEGYGRTEAGEGPWVLQVWRRVKREFRCVYAGDGPVFSRELGAWLVVVGDVLRVANDRAAEDLWPTTTEERDRARRRAARERRRAEQERLRAEQERLRAEQESSRAEQERLRAEQEHLRAEQERSRATDAEARATDAEARATAEVKAREDAEARVREVEARLRALETKANGAPRTKKKR